MRRAAAELAVPVLDRALANVLDLTLSEGEREHCEKPLAQARADLFAALTAICAEYPDLDNTQESDPETLERHGEIFDRERREAADSLRSTSASEGCAPLKAALALVDRAAVILHPEGATPELDIIRVRLSGARTCIQFSLDHLLGESGRDS